MEKLVSPVTKAILRLNMDCELNRTKDPVKYCLVYKEEGCSHVDGYLCNMHTCSIRKNYKNGKRS